MRVIIAGGRDFNDQRKLEQVCDILFSKLNKETLEIVSGTAAGADRLGEQYAKRRAYKLTRMPADWDNIEGKMPFMIGERPDGSKYFKGAGHARNRDMAEYADYLVAFWNGSSGTKNMIEEMKSRDKEIRIIKY